QAAAAQTDGGFQATRFPTRPAFRPFPENVTPLVVNVPPWSTKTAPPKPAPPAPPLPTRFQTNLIFTPCGLVDAGIATRLPIVPTMPGRLNFGPAPQGTITVRSPGGRESGRRNC